MHEAYAEHIKHASLFSIEQYIFSSSYLRCRCLSRAAAKSGSFSAAISSAVFSTAGVDVVVDVEDEATEEDDAEVSETELLMVEVASEVVIDSIAAGTGTGAGVGVGAMTAGGEEEAGSSRAE